MPPEIPTPPHCSDASTGWADVRFCRITAEHSAAAPRQFVLIMTESRRVRLNYGRRGESRATDKAADITARVV